MVPERRRQLVIRIEVDLLLAGEDRVLGVTVELGFDVRSVQMHDRAGRRSKLIRSVRAEIDRQKVLGTQGAEGIPDVADPVHGDGLVRRGLDRRSRELSVVTPECRGRQIAVQLLLEFRDRDLVLGHTSRGSAYRLGHRGDRQGIDEGLQ